MHTVCTYAFIPMRAAASECAEMVSQILFGESFEVLETEGRWSRVRTVFDSYEGWIDAKLVEPITPQEYDSWMAGHRVVVTPLRLMLRCDDAPMPQFIPAGSELRLAHSRDSFFYIGRKRYTFEPGQIDDHRCPSVYGTALAHYGTPYLWGGRSGMGIDCSGFTQTVCKIHGIDLPRDASQQAAIGTEVPVAEAREGDLAFFVNDNGRICHVGLCIGYGQIIHASGSVRIDDLTPQGIYNHERDVLTHKLLCVKRL